MFPGQRDSDRMIQLQDNGKCFVCGRNNHDGLAVAFEINREAKSISARFTPRETHQGFAGIIHGGILAALLDEAMVKLAFALGLNAVTAEMTMKFHAPAAPGEELLVIGRITSEKKRLVLADARIERGPLLIAEATGKLLRISQE